MDEIDKLLAKLNPAPNPSKPTQAANHSPTRSIDDLLTQLDCPQAETPQAPPTHDVLAAMKSEYEQQQKETLQNAELDRQQKQQRLEQLKRQRRAELTKKAAQWLRSLDLKSSEGQWFEEFACNYPSQLEAAIDYLEALQELTPPQD